MMLWVPAVVFLGVFASGSRSQVTVTQQPAMEDSLGSTVKIPCTVTGLSITSERVRWLQQKPGGAPWFLYHYHSSSDQGRGSGVPERFSVSPDTSGNLWNLVISGVQAEDEADYYCTTWDDGRKMFIFGGGTHLTVTGQPAVPPSVHLYPPSSEELQTKKEATLVCLMSGFYPSAVQVSWLVDGNEQSAGVETTKPTKQGDKYVASSYLKMSEANWKSHETYACKVTHDLKSYEKSVKRSDCP